MLEHTVDGFLLAAFFSCFLLLRLNDHEWTVRRLCCLFTTIRPIISCCNSSAFRIFDLIIMVTRRFKNNIVVLSSSTSSYCTLKCQPFLIWMLNSWFHAWWKKTKITQKNPGRKMVKLSFKIVTEIYGKLNDNRFKMKWARITVLFYLLKWWWLSYRMLMWHVNRFGYVYRIQLNYFFLHVLPLAHNHEIHFFLFDCMEPLLLCSFSIALIAPRTHFLFFLWKALTMEYFVLAEWNIDD